MKRVFGLVLGVGLLSGLVVAAGRVSAGLQGASLSYAVPTSVDQENVSFREVYEEETVWTGDPGPGDSYEYFTDFTEGGEWIYFLHQNPDSEIHSFQVSTPYDYANATYFGSTDFDPGGNVDFQAFEVTDSGQHLFIYNVTVGSIYKYALSTPYNLDTASLQQTLDLTTISGLPTYASPDVEDFEFSSDGTKLTIVGSGNSISYDVLVSEYTLSTPYDLSTMSWTDDIDLDDNDNPNGMLVTFSHGGLKLHVGIDDASSGRYIRQYSLTTPYDLSTRTFEGNFTPNLLGIYEWLPGAFIFDQFDNAYTIGEVGGLDENRLAIFEQVVENYYRETADGALDNSDPLRIVLAQDTFQDADNDDVLDVPGEVVISNVPAGLTPVVTLSDGDTVATLTFTGNATNHSDADDVASLTFEFQNSAFSGGSASAILNSGSGTAHDSMTGINFFDAPGGVELGLDLWLKADNGVYSDMDEWGGSSSAIADTEVVEAWHDSSVNIRHFDEANTSNPSWNENLVNFNPSIEFDGGDSLNWEESNELWYEGDAEQDVFTVTQAASVGEFGWIDTESGDSSEQLFAYMNGSSGYSFGVEGTASANSTDTGGTDIRTTDPTIFNFSYEGALSTVDDIYDAYVNGVEYPVTGSNNANGTIATGAQHYFLGNNDSGSGSASNWVGNIPEHFQYGRLLTATERSQVDSYLALKYGLTLDDQAVLGPVIVDTGVSTSTSGLFPTVTRGQTFQSTVSRQAIALEATVNRISGSAATINVTAYLCNGAMSDTACIASPDAVETIGITSSLGTNQWVFATPFSLTAGNDYTLAFSSDSNWGVGNAYSASPPAGTDYVLGDGYANGAIPGASFEFDISFQLLEGAQAPDYLASDGSTLMWQDDGDGYSTDIFGIGRDEASALDQRVSKSSNAGTIVTASLDSDDFTKPNTGVTNSHANDLQFLTFANDGGATTTQTTEIDTNVFLDRLTREWKVDKTANFGETVNLKFDGFDSNYSLIIKNDGDFSSGATIVGALNNNGEISGVTLNDGDHFTIAQMILPGPGGIATGMNLWLKANQNGDSTVDIEGITTDGADIASWYSQTSFGGFGNSSLADRAPATYTDGTETLFNFNASALFDGVGDAYFIPYLASGDQSYNNYAVFNSPLTNADNTLWANGNNGIPDDDFQQASITSTNRIEHNHPQVGDVVANASISANEHAFTNFFYDTSLDTKTIYKNGESLVSNTAYTDQNIVNTNRNIGYRQGPNSEYFGGYIAEVVFYEDALSDSDRQRVDSYFGLKYGLTVDQTIATDYIASDGTTPMWVAADNVSYDNNIFGIGRDDYQSLNQRVSRSFDQSGDVVTIALDANFTDDNEATARTTNHTNDMQFFMLGNNSGSTTPNTDELPAGYESRTPREWRVEKSLNFGQAINMKFDGFNDDYELLVDTDGDFSNDAVVVGALDANGEITGVNLADGNYITLANPAEVTSVEFSAASGASSNEATTDNLPSLYVLGTLAANESVNVSITSGTATGGGVDYTMASPITVTIPAGTYDGTAATEVSIPGLSLDDDSLLEGDETITLFLDNPSSADIAIGDADGSTTTQSTTTYTITDDETATISVAANDAIATENPETNGQFTITMSETNNTGAPISINFTVNGSSSATSGADYIALPVSADIADGQSSVTVTVDTTGMDDGLTEGDETVIIDLAAASLPSVTLGTPTQATVTIYDDETDTDGDGVPDAQEVLDGTSVSDPLDYQDTDGDLVPDYVELNDVPPTDINDPLDYTDTDGDGVPDYVETTLQPNNGEAATNENDAADNLDSDTGGVPDYVETILQPNRGQAATNPNDASDDDSDGDGISDTDEGVTPGGDGNGDGIPDAQQQEVASRTNPVTGAHITLEASGACAFVNGYTIVAESELTQPDDDFEYPVGLNDFELRCTTPGDSANVTFFYDQSYDTSDWNFKKYDDIGNEYSDITDIATFAVADVNGTDVTTVSYTLTDGGITDVDGVADGFINDPAGPAVLVAQEDIAEAGGVDGELSETGASFVGVMLAGGFVIITTSLLVGIPHREQ